MLVHQIIHQSSSTVELFLLTETFQRCSIVKVLQKLVEQVLVLISLYPVQLQPHCIPHTLPTTHWLSPGLLLGWTPCLHGRTQHDASGELNMAGHTEGVDLCSYLPLCLLQRAFIVPFLCIVQQSGWGHGVKVGEKRYLGRGIAICPGDVASFAGESTSLSLQHTSAGPLHCPGHVTRCWCHVTVVCC